MKNFYTILLVILLNAGISAQWIKNDFNDSNVLLCVDFYGTGGALGGWHFPGPLVNSYYTSDEGSTWHSASAPDSLRVITDLQIINDSLIYGCGAKNKIMPVVERTFDFNEMLSDRRKYQLLKQGILSEPANEQCRAQFLQSTDLGHSWQYKGLLSDTVVYLVDLRFLSRDYGYTLAHNDSSSGLLRTTDGGSTWNWSFLAGQDIGLYSFDFLDSLNGFIIGADPAGGLIVKTTDGGVTWSSMIMNGIIEISKIKCVPPSTITVSALDINFGQIIFISSDNGAAWDIVYSHPNMLVDGINGLPGGWIIFYGTYYPTGSSIPFVNGTTNMGESWVESNLSPLTDIVMAGSKMMDNEKWYITGTYMLDSGFLLNTSNSGGLPVELISFTATQAGNSINLRWTTTSEINNRGFEIQRRFETSDWHFIGFEEGKGTTTEIQNYSFNDDLTGISATKIYYRLKQTDLNGSFRYSDIVETDLNPLNTYLLEQNYPNPFNPTTTIRFGMQEKSIVRITILNSIGEEVAIILNEEKEPGFHQVEFNAEDLSSGVYFYRLQTGSYNDTKKMILLR